MIDLHEIRAGSSNKSFVFVQMNFAENYMFVRQREVQSAHWNNQQVTLFIIHIKIDKSHKIIVIISDYMPQDTRPLCIMPILILSLSNYC